MKTHQYRTIAFILGAIALWGAVIYFVPPGSLTSRVGLANAYLASFLIALIAGFSSSTGGAAYAAVIDFSRAGANPLCLGLASGIGLFLSDSFFYVLVLRGRQSVESTFKRLFTRLERFFKRIPDPFVYLFTYLFCALGPIPNDLVLGTLVIAGYRYRTFWPALLAGDITFMLFLSYLFQ